MTYKNDATKELHEADDTPLTAAQVGKRMPAAPSDPTTVMKGLYDDGYVDRVGEGKRGDPYRYELTAKGEAAANDLLNGDDDPPEDAGLGALFDSEAPDDPDEDDVDDPNPGTNPDTKPPRDPVEERFADVERYVDGVEARLSEVEDAVGSNNVAREDIKHRLRQIEDRFEDADRVVAFDTDKEFVECVLMVAQSDHGGASKKRAVISSLLGIEDRESKGLLSRVFEKAAEQSTDDTADHTEGGASE